MLTIPGRQSRFCDGISRRSFIKIGALGMGGLTLPEALRAEQRNGIGRSNKSIIMIYLPGGPPHQDMFDIKVDAPSEIRGEFKPIRTNVPGIRICEHLPLMAGMMDKLAPIRSVVGARDEHSDFQCMTGRLSRSQPPGGWPSFGAVVSKLLGPTDPAVPPVIGLEPRMQHRPYNAAGPGFLGVAHQSFRPHGEGKADMLLNGMTMDRLSDRRSLLEDVSVVVWGEFGRTPTINKDAGRDHWPKVSCALLAGGGMKVGQVIGSTDRWGGEANDRPVDFQEVFATLYNRLGIDASKTTIEDLTGRPRYLVEGFQPIRELI